MKYGCSPRTKGDGFPVTDLEANRAEASAPSHPAEWCCAPRPGFKRGYLWDNATGRQGSSYVWSAVSFNDPRFGSSLFQRFPAFLSSLCLLNNPLHRQRPLVEAGLAEPEEPVGLRADQSARHQDEASNNLRRYPASVINGIRSGR